ncbi:MAG: hypothetical protein J5726_07565 [Treponema sp.]|nr:hypothetical protein [Treponema sp.]
MEKQRSKSGTKSFGRLLKVLLCGIVWLAAGGSGAFAQTLTTAMIQAIRLTPAENQDLYVNSDIKFEAQIPYTLPGQIDVSMPDEMPFASFKTLRKVEAEGGTRIEIWYSFSREGTYTLPTLTIKIKNSRRRIQFNPVTVVLNPKDIRPSCVIVTDRGQNVPLTVYAGQKIFFRVCLRHAIQLLQFSWDIPKDSLFEQTRTYEFTQIKQREKVVSNELIPVSDFEWTPLVSGEMTFPQFKITAISYSGDREEVTVPPIRVTVLKARDTKADQNSTLFLDAFDASYVEPDYVGIEDLTAEDALYITQLRTKEKHSFLLLYKNRKQRVQAEKERGLPYSQTEFALMWIYLAAALVCAVVVLFIFFIRRKKSAAAVGLGIVLICSLILFIYAFVLGTKKYGITTGSQVYSIPEYNAGVKSELPCGNRVQIISQSGNWYFIRFGETEGWCLKEEILSI